MGPAEVVTLCNWSDAPLTYRSLVLVMMARVTHLGHQNDRAVMAPIEM